MKSNRIIEDLAELGECLEPEAHKKVVANAILEITRLNDENQSVWDMLEEIKASDIQNYKNQAEALAAEKILSLMALNRNRTDDQN